MSNDSLPTNLVDKWLGALKSKTVVAIIIVGGLFFGALGSIADSWTKLTKLISPSETPASAPLQTTNISISPVTIGPTTNSVDSHNIIINAKPSTIVNQGTDSAYGSTIIQSARQQGDSRRELPTTEGGSTPTTRVESNETRTVPIAVPFPTHSHTELMIDAWRAFQDKNYTAASAKCSELIELLKVAADENQATLEKRRAPQVPNGRPTDDEKRATLERAPLNDVAACYFILGRSAELAKLIDQARAAYINASRYTYARVWDKSGFFWSPSEAARARLASRE